MQTIGTSIERPSQPNFAAARNEPRGTGLVRPAVESSATRDPLARQAAEPAADRKPESKPENEGPSEGYRLNFDPEKRRVYLELLNTTTGDVIQRIPRDDIAFATAGALAETGVSLKA